MNKITIAAALVLSTVATGAFAQGATGNMNAPSMNSSGTGVTQPGTSSTGQAVDRAHSSGSTATGGTTGSATSGNNANSGSGSNSAANPNNKGGNGGAN